MQNLNILKNSKLHKQSLQKEINRKKDIIENIKAEKKVTLFILTLFRKKQT